MQKYFENKCSESAEEEDDCMNHMVVLEGDLETDSFLNLEFFASDDFMETQAVRVLSIKSI